MQILLLLLLSPPALSLPLLLSGYPFSRLPAGRCIDYGQPILTYVIKRSRIIRKDGGGGTRELYDTRRARYVFSIDALARGRGIAICIL